jgi:hypothetical protein
MMMMKIASGRPLFNQAGRIFVARIDGCRFFLFSVLTVVGLSGCQSDEIAHYQVAKTETRLLAAIVPHGDRTWFFKLTGPAAEVDSQRESFLTFLNSVRFTGKENEPMTWTVPNGWQQEKGSELRYATFRIKGQAESLELTVVGLGKEAGSRLANINRWRDQLGLKPLEEAELGQVSQEIKIAGESAVVVDMKGSGSGLGRMSAPFAARRSVAPEPDAGRLPFTYRLPEGWKERPPKDRISIAAFQPEDGSVDVTITAAGGELAANVARWRRQVGLPPATEEDFRKDCRPIDVAGISAQYVDLTGPESAGRERILAVVLERQDVTWFFKMKGPAERVAKQKAAFDDFVASIRFTGSPGS